MRATLDRLFHSPWFVLFLAAIPVALGLTVFDALSNRMTITDVVVEVAPAKPTGVAWDAGKGKLPDLSITIAQDGDDVASCATEKDTLATHCTLDADVKVREGAITLVVEDVDAVLDDRIAAVELALPADGARAIGEMLPSLLHYEVGFRARPLTIHAYTSRLSAIGIGALVALLAWLVLQKRVSTGAEPMRLLEVRVITWVAGALVLAGVGAGIAIEVADHAVLSPLFELPCGLGGAAAGLVWLHGHARARYTTMDGVILFFAIAAILMPIMVKAAMIVGAIALVYGLLHGLAESSWF